MQNGDWENKYDTTDNQMRDTASSVEERPKFDIDLRPEGVP